MIPALSLFQRGYIQALLNSASDDNDVPLDTLYTIHAINETDLLRLTDRLDIYETYVGDNTIQPDEDFEDAGYYFYHCSVGSGVAFTDNPGDFLNAELLTEHAKMFGGHDLYVGDDGTLYIYWNAS